MAVFVSFSDESAGKNQQDTFVFAGWFGPEEDWSRFFTPAWDERVLAGPPRIDYLHMTDIRSPKWRENHAITLVDAERRIDEGCIILDQLANLHPLRIVIDAACFRNEFREIKVSSIRRKQFNSATYEPDYLAFLAYAWAALKYLAEYHQEVEKLDFVVETKTTVTRHIEDFHADLPLALTALGNPKLARLVGTLNVAGKDRLPLQAADLLCWHSARREKPRTMTPKDVRRYKTIASHKGIRIPLKKSVLKKIKAALVRPTPRTDWSRPSKAGRG